MRLTRDGVPMVLHDVDLVRTTHGKYAERLIDLTADEVARLDVAPEERLPRLDQVLSWAQGRGALLNIELKAEQSGEQGVGQRLIDAVASELEASGLPAARVVLSSFEFDLVEGLLASVPQYPIALLVDGEMPVLDLWLERVESGRAQGGPRLVHPDVRLVTPQRVHAWRERGVGIGLWGITTREQWERATAMGADLLIVDQPGLDPVAKRDQSSRVPG